MRLLILVSCLVLGTSCATAQNASYPREWWQEVPRNQAASWEILPQDAGPNEVILSKRTELGIFSNFAETPFELDGKSYRSVEGFWQMMKFPENSSDPRSTFPGISWSHRREDVAQMIGFDAKAAGDHASANMKIMGINWVTYNGVQMPYRILEKGEHYKLIERSMRKKTASHQGIKDLLLSTGDLILRPDHKQGDDTPPAWKYYEIYMVFREELRSGTFHE